MEIFVALVLITVFSILTIISRSSRTIPLARAYNRTLDTQNSETAKRWEAQKHL